MRSRTSRSHQTSAGQLANLRTSGEPVGGGVVAGSASPWIQKAMGHASITTTARIYAHLYDDELDTVADALNDLRKPK